MQQELRGKLLFSLWEFVNRKQRFALHICLDLTDVETLAASLVTICGASLKNCDQLKQVSVVVKHCFHTPDTPCLPTEFSLSSCVSEGPSWRLEGLGVWLSVLHLNLLRNKMLAKIWHWLAPHSQSMTPVRDHIFHFDILEPLIFIKTTHLEKPHMNRTYSQSTWNLLWTCKFEMFYYLSWLWQEVREKV